MGGFAAVNGLARGDTQYFKSKKRVAKIVLLVVKRIAKYGCLVITR